MFVSIKFPSAAWMLKRRNTFPFLKRQTLPYRNIKLLLLFKNNNKIGVGSTTRQSEATVSSSRLRVSGKNSILLLICFVSLELRLPAREGETSLWDLLLPKLPKLLVWLWVLCKINSMVLGSSQRWAKGHLKQQNALGRPWTSESLGSLASSQGALLVSATFSCNISFYKSSRTGGNKQGERRMDGESWGTRQGRAKGRRA